MEAQFIPASDLLTTLRQVKDADELAAMREAQRVTDEALLEILNFIKPGLTESEVAARLTYIMARKGAERNSFDPIVACGANGSKPHAVPGPAVIEKGQFVTMDFGCVVHGYCSDMTRTVAIGHVTEEMEKVYNLVLEAQLASIAKIAPGVPCVEVDAAARDLIYGAGYEGCFGHGTGHSLGLQIHEDPRFSTTAGEAVCQPGIVMSVEPGGYLFIGTTETLDRDDAPFQIIQPSVFRKKEG